METVDELKKRTKQSELQNEQAKEQDSNHEDKNININVGKKITKTLILQVVSKMLSFVFNVLAARFVSKEVYGYSNVTLQFYYTFILFFIKECVRKALQKEIKMEKYSNKQRLRGALNIVTTCLALNFVIAISVILFLINYSSFTSSESILYKEHIKSTAMFSIILYLSASIFEALCEPCIILILDQVEYESKVYVEGTSLFIRGGILFVLLYFNLELLAFGLAHFIYGIIMLILYHYRIKNLKINKHNFNLYSIEKIEVSSESTFYLDTHKSQLFQMSFIGVFRFILAEGENLVLNFTSNLTMEQQGEYSLIANLCSIICRFIFQPLEELSYSIFGKESLKSTHIDYMCKLLKHLIFIGCVIISFSQNYSYTGLYILYKEKWTNDSTVAILQAYGVYIMAMGVNGVTEAFAMARSDKNTLRKMQYTMTVSSAIFIVAMFFFVRIGPTGIVYANILNMIARICTNMYIIKGICESKEEYLSIFSNSLPNWKVFIVIIFTYFICSVSKSMYEQTNLIIHLAIGAICGIATLIAYALTQVNIFIK